MESEPFVLALDAVEATLEWVGGKGASLARMASAGFPVPPGFHITTAAYRAFVAQHSLMEPISVAVAGVRADDPGGLERASADIMARFVAAPIPESISAAIRRAYAALDSGATAVAVRSSATAEDLPEMSFAGQQESFLNVCGIEQVLAAVQRCWASLWTARAIAYRARYGIRPEEVSLAVVVQTLIPADAAGVLFTMDPLTGMRDHVRIDAAWGLGEAIVSGQVTPDQLVVTKATGAISHLTVADKEVMTIRTATGTQVAPVPSDRRACAVLTPPQVAELARLGVRIEALYGCPMDIEWAIADGQVFVLQARPITALAERSRSSATSASVEWSLPHPQGRYFRSSAIELLPEPISPLFATLGLSAWDEAMLDLMASFELSPFMPPMSFTTINGYAYQGMIWTPRENIKFLRIVPQIGRLAPVLVSARQRWLDARRDYAAVVRRWEAVDLASASAQHLFDGVGELTRTAAHFYTVIQSGILPIAYSSEALFTLWYQRVLQRPADPPALTFLLGFDSAPIQAEKSLYDLACWVRGQPELVALLRGVPGDRLVRALREQQAPFAQGDAVQDAFYQRFMAHLAQFGHMLYDLDFAQPVPADDPAPLFETLKFFLDEQVPDPHQRQRAAVLARERAVGALLSRERGVRLAIWWKALRIAQQFAPLREDALADIGMGWPQVRRMVHEIGRRCVAGGAFDGSADVFWLTEAEVRGCAAALDAQRSPGDWRAAVRERRATWQAQRALVPPTVLPVKGGATILGIDFDRWMPAHTEQEGDLLKGIGTSPGRISGTARVIHGPDEFDQLQRGDILVAKITTPAWTPLFALAGGIVTDVGGPLSHGSIVAREYHIPAVLGTGVATARVRSGQRITIDGDAGTVLVALH